MKKTILTVITMLAMTQVAQADMNCTVQSKDENGAYSKIIATKKLTAEENQIIVTEEDVNYLVRLKNENIQLTVYKPAQQEIIALSYGSKGKLQMLLIPSLNRTLTCFEM